MLGISNSGCRLSGLKDSPKQHPKSPDKCDIGRTETRWHFAWDVRLWACSLNLTVYGYGMLHISISAHQPENPEISGTTGKRYPRDSTGEAKTYHPTPLGPIPFMST